MVQRLDVRTGELSEDAYDLVTCRALLHQIAEYAPAVLARMAAAVKPGGWLLVQEPDFHPRADHGARCLGDHLEGLDRVGARQRVDWLIGRTLPSMISKLDLGRPQAKTDVQNIRGRDRGALYFRLFFAEVRDRVVDSGLLDAATFDAAAGLLVDSDYWTQRWMMTAVWARKPVA
jgi:Methyltransferase domain